MLIRPEVLLFPQMRDIIILLIRMIEVALPSKPFAGGFRLKAPVYSCRHPFCNSQPSGKPTFADPGLPVDIYWPNPATWEPVRQTHHSPVSVHSILIASRIQKQAPHSFHEIITIHIIVHNRFFLDPSNNHMVQDFLWIQLRPSRHDCAFGHKIQEFSTVPIKKSN